MITRSKCVTLIHATLAIPSNANASPVGLASSLDGARIFVAMEKPPSVMVFDGAAGSPIATWSLPHAPKGITSSPDGTRLYLPACLASRGASSPQLRRWGDP